MRIRFGTDVLILGSIAATALPQERLPIHFDASCVGSPCPHNIEIPGLPPNVNLMDVLAGDFDGDGDVDLYNVSSGADTLLVNGMSPYGDPQGKYYLLGLNSALPANFAQRGAVGDLDGDQDLDVIVVTAQPAGGGSIVFRRNDGLLTIPPFGDASGNIPVSGGLARARSVLLVDWNLDGHLDIFVGTENGLRYFSNSAATPGWFSDDTAILTAAIPGLGSGTRVDAIATADVNADGYPDLYVGSRMPTGGPMADSLVLGTFNGGFLDGTVAFLGTNTPTVTTSAALADLNGDGHPDLVLGTADYSTTGGKVQVRMNLQSMVFVAPVDVPSSDADVRDFAIGDVNDDGLIDVVSVSHPGQSPFTGSGQSQLFLSTGDFLAPLALDPMGIQNDIGSQTNGALLADMDRDLDLDLMVADNAPTGNSPHSVRMHPNMRWHLDDQAYVQAGGTGYPISLEITTMAPGGPIPTWTFGYLSLVPPGPWVEIPGAGWLAIDPANAVELTKSLGGGGTSVRNFTVPLSFAGSTLYTQGVTMEIDPAVGWIIHLTNVIQQHLL